jgi:uroporphyrinogen-III decarboxylase
MSMGMTIRERMMAVYRNQTPDRIPVSIYARYLPRGHAERQARELGVGILDFHPLTTLLAPPLHLYPGFLSEVRGADFKIRFTWQNGQRIEERSYETPVGTVTQRSRQEPTYGSDWTEKFYIASREDYRIMQYLVKNTVIQSNESAFPAKREDMGDDGVILGRVDRCPFQKLLIELAGPERFLVDLATDPEPVLELLNAMEKKMDEVFDSVCESSATVIWQPDNISCDMTSPKYFERFCLPYYIKRGEQLHERGKVYVVHMDGRLRAIRELVARTPIDCIESYSFPEIGGDLPFAQARASWPDKVITPNFPSSLATQSREHIVSFIEGFLRGTRPYKTLMLQVSEDLPPGTWSHVLSILCECVQE